VLVVKRVKNRLERVLVCTGGADVALPVIEAGAWLAQGVGARVTLLHVGSPVPSMYAGLGEIEETLSDLLQTDTPFAQHLREGAELLAERRVESELKLRYGVVADEILCEIQEGDHDLVVIGASGAGGGGWLGGRLLGNWLLGNVTRQVLNDAPCSVLVLRRTGPRFVPR